MYDYVIVGAGSAGCVLAARLSEDPDVSVLLIEAGPPDDKENIHVPAAFGSLFKTDVDWDYATVARGRLQQPDDVHAARQDARRLLVDQRDGLHPRAPRRLRRLGEGTGWGYDEVLPYFKRARTTSAASPSTTASAGR